MTSTCLCLDKERSERWSNARASLSRRFRCSKCWYFIQTFLLVLCFLMVVSYIALAPSRSPLAAYKSANCKWIYLLCQSSVSQSGTQIQALDSSHLALGDSSLEDLLKGLVCAIFVFQIDHCNPHIILFLYHVRKGGGSRLLHLPHEMRWCGLLASQEHGLHQYLQIRGRRTCI
jgi:hypothetical protein